MAKSNNYERRGGNNARHPYFVCKGSYEGGTSRVKDFSVDYSQNSRKIT